MPVSAKRKKDGKPVRRAQPAGAAGEEGEGTTGPAAGEPQRPFANRPGKPRNPFVEKHGHKPSQRGR